VGLAYGYDFGASEYWAKLVRPHFEAAENLTWLDDAFELAEIAVLPDSQRRGVGRDLFDALNERVSRRRVVLGADEARGWWERVGFTTLTDAFSGNYVVMGLESEVVAE
jgi:ribosomal protein S18 acetylase RimI-like enzyme